MRISFAVFADAANLSQEGKLNVLGMFDALQVSAFPTVHPRAHFVLRLKGRQGDVGTHVLTFRWTNPRGNELWQSTGELQLAAQLARQPGAGQHASQHASQHAPADTMFEMDLPVIAVVDLPLDVGGQYTMNVDLDNTPVSQVHLFVNGPVRAMPTVGLVS